MLQTLPIAFMCTGQTDNGFDPICDSGDFVLSVALTVAICIAAGWFALRVTKGMNWLAGLIVWITLVGAGFFSGVLIVAGLSSLASGQ